MYDGNYVVRAVGDPTPGEGPAPTTGCDFTIEGADAEETEDAAEDSDDEASDEVATDEDEASATELATTGASTTVQTLLAQLALTSGLMMLAMGRVAQRRSRL